MKIRLDERTEKLTERIIGSAFEVLNELGHGFPEVIYQKALAYELAQSGISVEQQVPFQVRYKGALVGNYYADIVVDRRVIIELKTVEKLVPAHVEAGPELSQGQHPSCGITAQFLQTEARISPRVVVIIRRRTVVYPCPPVSIRVR